MFSRRSLRSLATTSDVVRAEVRPARGGKGVTPQARPRRARRARSRRGVALIMVLGTLTVLTVMLTEFQDETSAELGSALSERDAVRAEYAARSGVALSRLLIASEPTIRSRLGPLLALMAGGGSPPQIPVWNYADAVLGAFGDTEGGQAFSNLSGLNLAEGRNLGMAGAGFELLIVDEDSKINLNLGARPGAFNQQRLAQQIYSLIGGIQYNPLFEQLDDQGEVVDRQAICQAMVDWVDDNTDVEPCDLQTVTATQSRPEDSYYQLLPQPYQRKNAAFDSLQELHLVRGVKDDFWGTFITPDPDDPESRNVTVWGGDSGAVNVNTANVMTLLALACSQAVEETPLCTDPEQQMTFLSTLKMAKMMMPGIPVFTSPKSFVSAVQGKGMIGSMLSMVNVEPIQLKSATELEKAVAVESKVFSIYATGHVRSGQHETKVRVHAVVDFRGAPPPGAASAMRLSELTGGIVPQGPGEEGESSGLPDQFQEGGLESLFRKNPAGDVIYYRVD